MIFSRAIGSLGWCYNVHANWEKGVYGNGKYTKVCLKDIANNIIVGILSLKEMLSCNSSFTKERFTWLIF
jgi:hypothetical protein